MLDFTKNNRTMIMGYLPFDWSWMYT